jgi:D-glycero-D-manno-heptose 1,7-bisphosphate phosphatase
MKKLSALFIDRDGVLNQDSDDYITSLDEIVMIPNAGRALRAISQKQIPIFIISNQSGIARGYYSETEAKLIFEKVIYELAFDGAIVTDYYYCPHLPDKGCLCRKPGTALFEKAADEYQFDLSQSAFIGDNISDFEAATRLSIPFYLVNTGKGEKTARILREQNVLIKPKTLNEISNLLLKEYL